MITPETWTCHWDQMPNVITVGVPLILDCQGQPAQLNEKNLQIIGAVSASAPPAKSAPSTNNAKVIFSDPYLLSIQKVNLLTPSEARLTVVSYRVGSHHLSDAQLTDGMTTIGLTGPDWAVASVIKPGQKVAPYGPYGPYQMELHLGWDFWLLFLLVVVAVITSAVWFIRRRLQRRNWTRTISKSISALGPYPEFCKSMRALLRQFSFDTKTMDANQCREFVPLLNSGFRRYLAEEFLLPIQDWPTRTTLRNVRRYHKKFYRVSAEGLRQGLHELDRALSSEKPLSPGDCRQLLDLIRKRADEIWKARESRHRSSQTRGGDRHAFR